MSDNPTIFAVPQADANNAPVVQAIPASTVPPEVAEYVGEGKKYSSVDDALKSVPHAQKFIDKLSVELEEAKKELEKRKTAEELLTQIKSGIPFDPTPQVASVTPESIARIVEQTITQKQQQVEASVNTKKVAEAFLTQYADKAESVYNSLAAESGLSVAMLNQLAATSPTAVLRMAGLTGGKGASQSASHSASSINTDALKPTDNTQNLSARVKAGASTKDLVNAWKIAGQKVNKPS